MPDENVYEVSHIVDEDCSNPKQRLFLVRWLGYTSEYDSWEPLENLKDGALDVVREWERKNRKRNPKEAKATVLRRQTKRSSSQMGDDLQKQTSRRTLQAISKPFGRIPTALKNYPKKTPPGRKTAPEPKNLQPITAHSHVQAGTPLYKIDRSSGIQAATGKQKNYPQSGLHKARIIISDDDSENEEEDTGSIQAQSPTLERQTRKPQYPPELYTSFLAALDDISGPPVWVVNDVDTEICPPLVFKWIEEYHLSDDVPGRDDHFSHGCSCPGDECDLEDPHGCECLDDSEEKKFAYDGDGLIHHPPGTAIFECNNKCGCGSTCPNRVVQRGRRMPLEIFKTQSKGWGVRTCRPIPKGMFVCRYIGEVITEAEAERRGEEYDRKVLDPGITYLFDLDFFRNEPDQASDIGSPEPDGSLFSVDAMRYGNVSRFFNHSCNPNVAIYTVVKNGDNRVYDLAIFALRPIKPYEELCFDYQTKKGVKVQQRCYCGDKNCRGWLFGI